MSKKATHPEHRCTTKRLLFSALLFLTLGMGTSQAQDFSFVGNFGGHGYYLSTGTGTWIQSHVKAVNAGLNLVHISSPAENTYVTTTVPNLAWIGLGTGLNFSYYPTDLSIYRWSDSVVTPFLYFGSILGAQ